MKKTIAVVMALIMALMLVACGASQEMKDASGTYKCREGKFVGDTEWQPDDDDFTIELKDDGTGKSTRGLSSDITWKVEGETFTMHEELGNTDYTGTLKDGELHIYNGDPTNDITYEYILVKG